MERTWFLTYTSHVLSYNVRIFVCWPRRTCTLPCPSLRQSFHQHQVPVPCSEAGRHSITPLLSCSSLPTLLHLFQRNLLTVPAKHNGKLSLPKSSLQRAPKPFFGSSAEAAYTSKTTSFARLVSYARLATTPYVSTSHEAIVSEHFRPHISPGASLVPPSVCFSSGPHLQGLRFRQTGLPVQDMMAGT